MPAKMSGMASIGRTKQARPAKIIPLAAIGVSGSRAAYQAARAWSAKGMRAAVRVILGQKPLVTRASLTFTTEGTRAFFGSRTSAGSGAGSAGLALAVMA